LQVVVKNTLLLKKTLKFHLPACKLRPYWQRGSVDIDVELDGGGHAGEDERDADGVEGVSGQVEIVFILRSVRLDSRFSELSENAVSHNIHPEEGMKKGKLKKIKKLLT
jgi:hypothetical protein